jgi:hypothetical protein
MATLSSFSSSSLPSENNRQGSHCCKGNDDDSATRSSTTESSSNSSNAAAQNPFRHHYETHHPLNDATSILNLNSAFGRVYYEQMKAIGVLTIKHLVESLTEKDMKKTLCARLKRVKTNKMAIPTCMHWSTAMTEEIWKLMEEDLRLYEQSIRRSQAAWEGRKQ